jgi:hypothetical protein
MMTTLGLWTAYDWNADDSVGPATVRLVGKSTAGSVVERRKGYRMSLSQSRIHRHLGLPARLLTFEDVEEAFHGGLEEERDLDWKTVPPKDLKGAGGDEYAKDVTAMANTDGGLLVYGVSEAQRMVGLAPDVNDDTIRTLEQTLLHRTEPHVRDVRTQRLASTSDPSKSLLIVSVPRSDDAPHLVVRAAGSRRVGSAMTAWERRGSDTVPMDERMLAQSYRRRFDSDANLEHRATELRRFAAAQSVDGAATATATATAWLVIAATPTRPPIRPRRVERSIIGERIRRAVADAHHRAPNAAEVLGKLDSIWDNPRTGYGRWVVSNFVAPQDSGFGRPMYLELHHDGAVVVAINVSWRVASPSDGAADVEIGAVERGVSEIVSLAHVHATEAGAESEIDFSAELIRADTRGGPFVAVRQTLTGNEYRDSWTRPMRQAQLVRAEAPAVRAEPDLAMVTHELGDCILSQFGVLTELGRPALY